MSDSLIKTRDLIFTLLFSLLIVFYLFFSSYFDQRTEIVFCDVGQGDAAYIRIKNNFDVLIDSGPNRKVLDCLGKYMPFWDRKVEIAVLTHPDSDHYGGFIEVANHYQIGDFITNSLTNKSLSFNNLKKTLISKHIPTQFVFAGQSFAVFDSNFDFYWPVKDYQTVNDNDLSFIILFQENRFRALFCGDSPNYILDRVSRQNIKKVDVLEVPHHGSAHGLSKKFLDLADPGVAVISVGKNNPYGHPSGKVLDMLKAKNIKVKRTDKDGDIVFKIENL